MLKNSLIRKKATQKGMIGENKDKGTEGEEEETQDLNKIVRRIGDELNINEMNYQKTLTGHVENERLWKLQKCLVGKVAAFCETKSLADIISGMGLCEISMKRIQGNYFLIKIPDEELTEILKQKEWSYLKEFFIHIELWLERGYEGKEFHGSKYQESPCIAGTTKLLKGLLVYGEI